MVDGNARNWIEKPFETLVFIGKKAISKELKQDGLAEKYGDGPLINQ
ncbi:MAG: hypothetical protein WC044_00110 [Crocinitomicaceae bacterium]